MCGFAAAIVLVLAVIRPAPANADPGVTVFPGMEIHQGNAACVVGFVEPQMRIALTSGRCDVDPIVTDSRDRVIGVVLLARTDTLTGSNGPAAGVEYEVIKLSPSVGATQQLPIGRPLDVTPRCIRSRRYPCVARHRLVRNPAAGSAPPATAGLC